MKTIEERVNQWAVLPLSDADRRNLMRMALIELADDLQAEKEKEVTELRRERDLAIANARNAYEKVCEALNKVREEKDAMSATIAQQDVVLDEVKRVLAWYVGNQEPDWECACEQCRNHAAAHSLLTRLSHE